MSKRPLVVWLAASDRIAHARRANDPRTVCGKPGIAERLAWPERTRCPVCFSLVRDLNLEPTPTRRRNP